jgi:class 3 adenylate cyclase/tetratricopeptide (TPR) repeat protein
MPAVSSSASSALTSSERVFDAYVPRGVLIQLAAEPFHRVREVDGSMLFADLSGFTRLSERLQRRGAEGAELLVGTINRVFEQLLRVAYDNGGSLIKFGGDALLLFFEGEDHARRATHAAFRMRKRLRAIVPMDVAGVSVRLRMTVGVHTGDYQFFLVGESHLEPLVVGSGASGIVHTEALADNGQIVVSANTAAQLPRRVLGPAVEDCFLLRSDPLADDLVLAGPMPLPPAELVGRALSTAVRAHVADGGSLPEHRRASIAFLQFRETNRILATEGIEALADALHEVVSQTQRAADSWGVCFLDSDVDADGGKLLLTAGVPRTVGDDEERLLLTLRQVMDAGVRLPIRIGVNRGPVFTGEIGPSYRRSYIAMGDTTNLAARLMGKAQVGQILASPAVLDRCPGRFATERAGPFMMKGKLRPVEAFAVGPPVRSPVARAAATGPVLVGRAAELAVLDEMLTAAIGGRGGLVEIVGEAGVGKSRILGEIRPPEGVRRLSVHCEAQDSLVPYRLWQGVLRALLGSAWDEADEALADRLSMRCAQLPGLSELLPLVAGVLGLDAPPTRTTAALLPRYRAQRTQEAVLALLEPELARPTLLVIDAAHLLDEASAAVLAGLSAVLAESAWLLVIARRGGPSAMLAEHIRRIEPASFTVAESRTLVHALTDAAPLPGHVVDLVVERSGGNPQFLLDLLAAVGSDLPDSVQAATVAQIDGLPPGDRALLRRAGVLGTAFPARLAAAVLAVPAEDPRWARLDAFLATADGAFRFRRAMVQEVAYAAVPYVERRVLHAAVADALEADPADRTDPGVLAAHHRLAGRDDRAYPLALQAAQRAAACAAPADAARLYRAALESARAIRLPLHELTGVWEGLGEALRLAGESAPADRAYRQARRTTGGDPVGCARLLHRQARLAHRSGHPAAGVRWARRGLRALDGLTGDQIDAWRARLLATEAADRMDQGRARDAVALCRAALELAGDGVDETGARARAHASYLLDWALVVLGRNAEAVHSPAALEIFDRLGDLEEKSKALNNLGMFAYWEGRWDDAVRLYRECGELAERTGDVETAATARCNIGEVLSDQGDWPAAAEALQDAYRVWRASGNDGGAGFARMLLGRTAARSGRSDEGIGLLEAAAEELARHGMEDAVVARTYLAEALSYAGRGEEALALLAALWPTKAAGPGPLLLRGRAVARAGAGAAAVRADLVEALEAARLEGNAYEVGLCLDLLCTLPTDEVAKLGIDLTGITAWRPECDAIFGRFGVHRLPPAPWADGSESARAMSARSTSAEGLRVLLPGRHPELDPGHPAVTLAHDAAMADAGPRESCAVVEGGALR